MLQYAVEAVETRAKVGWNATFFPTKAIYNLSHGSTAEEKTQRGRNAIEMCDNPVDVQATNRGSDPGMRGNRPDAWYRERESPVDTRSFQMWSETEPVVKWLEGRACRPSEKC